MPGRLYAWLLCDNKPAPPYVAWFLNSSQCNNKDDLVERAKIQAAEGLPLILDIERAPGTGFGWSFEKANGIDAYFDAMSYAGARLSLASGYCPHVSFYGGSQNGLGQAWKDEGPSAVYESRLDELGILFTGPAKPVCQLYLSWTHQTAIDEGRTFPITQAVSRMVWFATQHAARGKEETIFLVGLTPGGTESTRWADPDYVQHVTQAALALGHDVVLWGGQGATWDLDNPTCQVVAQLLDAGSVGPAPI